MREGLESRSADAIRRNTADVSEQIENGHEMTLDVRPFKSVTELVIDLEAMALSSDKVVFRGHQDERWKIESTYARFTSTPHEAWDSTIDEMLSHFIASALTIGPVPVPVADRRGRLEYGRHHGIPTPVIDFSHSPYVGLYFAFNGIQYRHGSSPQNAAIYALNLGLLGTVFARDYGGSTDHSDAYAEFMYEQKGYFDHGYPAGTLKLVPFCASWNARMRSQLGCFIYDTLDYSGAGVGHGNFEDWIASLKEPTGPAGRLAPILTKFLIPHSAAGEVFSRLELMNMTGAKLLDREGLATDVKNTYNYSRKSGYVWDLAMEPPDDTKMR